MLTMMATVNVMQKNFLKYIASILKRYEVVITDNGKEIGKLVPKEKSATPLTDSMIGILKSEDSVEEERENYLRQKYEIDN
jgi:antitoxin (DNA-binding transcriptional repressor) of toxin-antitoxin stability system